MQDIMRTKNESIIAIDRGKKHIGLACVAGETDVVMPLGVVQHDATALYTLAHILAERRVTRVLVGYPSRVPHIQRAIDAFIRDL